MSDPIFTIFTQNDHSKCRGQYHGATNFSKSVLALDASLGGDLGLCARANFRRTLNIKIQSSLGKISRTIYFSRDRSKLTFTRRTQAATAVK